jgi:hypothetical protein
MSDIFVHIKKTDKKYTEEEFISLSGEERVSFAKALSPSELSQIILSAKYRFDEKLGNQVSHIISLIE